MTFQRLLPSLLIALFVGCGDPAPDPVSIDQMAKAKVEAFKKLADAMANEPNGMEARAALENFRTSALDPKSHRAEAQEIVTIYEQRVRGKFQGEVAKDVELEMAPIQAMLK